MSAERHEEMKASYVNKEKFKFHCEIMFEENELLALMISKVNEFFPFFFFEFHTLTVFQPI